MNPPVLKDYIPDGLGGPLGDTFAHATLQGLIHDPRPEPRKLSENNLSAYKSAQHETAITARSIADSISWHNLDDEHPLKPNSTGSDFSFKEWDKINTYAKIRGTAAHSLQTAENAEEASRKLHSKISEIRDVDEPETTYSLVYRWPGSRNRMTPPEAVNSFSETYEDKLYEFCKDGARLIEDNWHAASQHHGLRVIINEPILIVEIDGILYCARPDQICYTDGSPTLPDGMYTVDAKATARIRPKNIVQAEAQRRAVDSRVADDKDVHSILLHLGVEDDEWDIHTSLDDDWPAEQAWDTFQQRAETLYSHGAVQAEISILD